MKCDFGTASHPSSVNVSPALYAASMAASADARSLLPPERTSVGARGLARVADVSRYWAMPNLRPMKDSSEGFLTFLKVSSFCILSVTLGVVVSHDAASRRGVATAPSPTTV